MFDSNRTSEFAGREMPREECGVVGVWGHPEAAKFAYLGLYALQHRGQEAAGIAAFDGAELKLQRGMGLVSEVFNKNNLDTLTGAVTAGHVRYSTTGSNIEANCQPIVAKTRHGQIALAHNGNLVNSTQLRQKLESKGAIFQTSMDTEIILHLIARSKSETLADALDESLNKLDGAYSLVLICGEELIAVRDPHGFRPLCLGQTEGAQMVASESCAFSVVNGHHVRDLKPGEVLTINKRGVHSRFPLKKEKEAFCIFEYIYFSRPDSMIAGLNVYEKRLQLGAQLAREHPAKKANLVIPVPDSSNAAALGFAREAGIPFALGLIRSHYIGRTFIEPDQRIRHFGARLKYTPVSGIIRDKSVVIVDDSIVRGTTSEKIVAMVREAGAREVHLRISSPPWKEPCYYGIDTPSRSELIAGNYSVEDIRRMLKADSLGYLSIEGLLKVFDNEPRFCTACFTRKYPAGVPEKTWSKEALEGVKGDGRAGAKTARV